MGDNGKSQAISDQLIALYMKRRQSMLMELAGIEDFLIACGRLERRSTVSRRERKRGVVDIAQPMP